MVKVGSLKGGHEATRTIDGAWVGMRGDQILRGMIYYVNKNTCAVA